METKVCALGRVEDPMAVMRCVGEGEDEASGAGKGGRSKSATKAVDIAPVAMMPQRSGWCGTDMFEPFVRDEEGKGIVALE